VSRKRYPRPSIEVANGKVWLIVKVYRKGWIAVELPADVDDVWPKRAGL